VKEKAGQDVAEGASTIGEWQRRAARRLEAAGIEPAETLLEAEVLLRHVLGLNRAQLLARRADRLPAQAAAQLTPLLDRRLAREPLAYITGRREFFGLEFTVDRRVLIPRPETEGLVERVIGLAHGAPAIVDVGTGSGCIAVGLAVHLPSARLTAVDVSAEALALARLNAARHGVAERISFVQGDLLSALGDRFDIIVSNPPYILSAEIATLQPEITRYEPHTALDGGGDGLDVIRCLLRQARVRLKPGGALVLEIGAGQGQAVAALARAALPGARVTVEHDLAGLERYVIALWETE
jgi:release factor glutamine methyltransferase